LRGLLEYPHFTRPRAWEGLEIPEVLLTGDHARIKAWREAEALRINARKEGRICSNGRDARFEEPVVFARSHKSPPAYCSLTLFSVLDGRHYPPNSFLPLSKRSLGVAEAIAFAKMGRADWR